MEHEPMSTRYEDTIRELIRYRDWERVRMRLNPIPYWMSLRIIQTYKLRELQDEVGQLEADLGTACNRAARYSDFIDAQTEAITILKAENKQLKTAA